MYGKYPKHRGQQIASGPLRRLVAADQLVRVGRDQDRPGRQARRGRPPAGLEGHPGDRPGPQRPGRQRPHQPVQQPRPLLDRGPGPAHRRAEDVEPARQGHREGPGGAGHRHHRHRHRQGGRRRHHDVGLRRRHRRRPPARAAARRACPARSARCSPTTPSPRRASATGSRSGRTAACAAPPTAIKLICMGANRLGFGTASMVAIGCTICRGCQLDTCHVGIATQIDEHEAARARPQALRAAGVRPVGGDAGALLHRDGRRPARAGRPDGRLARCRSSWARPTAWCRSPTTTAST